MSKPYMASSLPDHQVAELHRLMSEEIKEVAVLFADPEGFITVWNSAAEDMAGFTAQDAIGHHVSLLYTDEQKTREWPRHNLDEAKKTGFYKEETWRSRKDGSVFWARIALTALRDPSGTLVGFSMVTVDLSDHRRLALCVKERSETLRILRTAKAGMWTWRPDTGQVEVCGNFMAMPGYHETPLVMTLARWLDSVDPVDRPEVAAKFVQMQAGGPGAPLLMETRMRQKDGNSRWFHVHADWSSEKSDGPDVLSGVNVDIHAFKTAGECLRQAVDKLEDADARKDEFLAMLAHELRNPLAPIRAAAELLKIARLNTAQVQQTSEIIGRQVDHMTSLVDDLLDVSRVNRGLAALEKKPLDLRQIVTDAVEQVNPLIGARRQRLSLELSAEPAWVEGDHKRLVQVVGNLLNNAAKYTPEGGSILLKTERQDSRVLLSVTDNGIGMEPGLAVRVFDLFAQAERTPDRSSGGLGLGLALVKSLAELHGGAVSCVSAGSGRGSQFTVDLPLLARPGQHPAPRTNDPALPVQEPLRVMIVDDNADAAQMLAMFLQAYGHEVLVEYGARQALERARLESPDVFLLDIGLPDLDGHELARLIRREPQTADAVLIAITGYSQERDRKTAMEAGFQHYLVKPVDTAKLVELLAGVA